MYGLIKRTLERCGYSDSDPTEQSLIKCFLDYVDTGAFSNLDYDEAVQMIEDGELTVKQICANLLKLK